MTFEIKMFKTLFVTYVAYSRSRWFGWYWLVTEYIRKANSAAV